MADVSERYRTVSEGFDAAVAAAHPDLWDRPSPCEGWSARDVVAHIVEGHRGVIAGATGSEPGPLGADEDPAAAWREVADSLREITGDPALLATEIDGPFGAMPVGEIVGRFVTMDLLVHTWDLATAVGAGARLEEDAVRDAFELLAPMDEMIRRPGIFGPKVEPSDGADLQERFLAFLGRTS